MVGEETKANEVECNSFFEEMDDLVDDFPAANYDTTGIFSGASSDDISAIWSNPLPYEDIAQLEWLSEFVEDSFSSEGLTITKQNSTSLNKELSPSSSEESQTSSLVSNTESCFSDEKSSKKGFRTKRARPATFNPPSFPNPSEYQNTKKVLKLKVISSSSENNNKVKKTKPNVVPQALASNGANVRKCTHCEITQTPQWRAGPLGPKTLCNACGVRHKTGRLFPEYRPAASPTFVASLHSNSHKKVLEMRNKGDF